MKSQVKIGIVTLYDSINCGTFLQAYAFWKYLEKNEKVAVNFIKWEHKKKFLKAIRYIKTKHFKAIPFLIKNLIKFDKCGKQIPVNSISSIYDVVFIGSDELWNLTNPSFEHSDILFGKNIRAKKIATYAVSCAQCEKETLKDNKGFRTYGLELSGYSVRDEHTKNILDECGISSVKVVDPTLLISWDKYVPTKRLFGKKYVLVYAFSVDENHKIFIKNFARENDCVTISVGMYQQWCDHNISVSPMEFLWFVKNAEYIFSGTFHGTVFSVLFHKNFYVISAKQNKINDFLKMCALEHRVLDNLILEDLKSGIDYLEVENSLSDIIKESEDYIKYILENAKIKN